MTERMYEILVSDGSSHPAADTASALRAALSNGQRLSVYLRPDHKALAITTPEYDEAYALPFVFCEGDAVAGLTRTGHYLVDEKGLSETISFSYNIGFPYYSIQFPYRFDRDKYQIATKLMSRTHYQVFEFKTQDPARLVFEVDEANGYQRIDHGLSQSIRTGRTHFVTIGLPGDRLWSLPVDISYDFFETGEVEFRTETVLTSKHVLLPLSFHKQLGQNNAHIIEAMSHPNADLDIFLPAETTFLTVKADGTFATKANQPEGPAMKYSFLKVFEYP